MGSADRGNRGAAGGPWGGARGKAGSTRPGWGMRRSSERGKTPKLSEGSGWNHRKARLPSWLARSRRGHVPPWTATMPADTARVGVEPIK